MRAGMPADHDAARTGELSVSGPIRQTNRPTGTRQPRPVCLGKRCSDALDAGRVPRIPPWERRRPRRPNTLHCEEHPIAPVDRGSSVGGLTRIQPGKPCRRGRRRSQGCLRTMRVSGVEEFPVAPVGRGSSVGGLTRMEFGKPCRRGRRRSQGGPLTMTVSAVEEYPVAPVDRGSSVGGLTRMQPGKPCRRGRRRSQGCLRTMTGSAVTGV